MQTQTKNDGSNRPNAPDIILKQPPPKNPEIEYRINGGWGCGIIIILILLIIIIKLVLYIISLF